MNIKTDPEKKPNIPPSPTSKSSKNRTIKILLILLLTATAGMVVYGIFNQTPNKGNSSNDSGSYLPIWIAVLIPIFIAKKNKNMPQDKKMILSLLAGLFLLLGAIIFVFVLKK